MTKVLLYTILVVLLLWLAEVSLITESFLLSSPPRAFDTTPNLWSSFLGRGISLISMLSMVNITSTLIPLFLQWSMTLSFHSSDYCLVQKVSMIVKNYAKILNKLFSSSVSTLGLGSLTLISLGCTSDYGGL